MYKYGCRNLNQTVENIYSWKNSTKNNRGDNQPTFQKKIDLI